jgi:hypothetical protein
MFSALREVYFFNNMLAVGFGLGACLFALLTFHSSTTRFFGLIILGGALSSIRTFFPIADSV